MFAAKNSIRAIRRKLVAMAFRHGRQPLSASRDPMATGRDNPADGRYRWPYQDPQDGCNDRPAGERSMGPMRG
jgi:hypothetical protein